MTTQTQETIKVMGDAMSVTTVVATLVAWLPPAAALASLVWTTLRIIEMCTGKPMHELLRKWFDKTP